MLTFHRHYSLLFLNNKDPYKEQTKKICKTCQVVKPHLGWTPMSGLCSAICRSVRSAYLQHHRAGNRQGQSCNEISRVPVAVLTAIYIVVVIALYVYRGGCGRNQVGRIGEFDESSRDRSRRGLPRGDDLWNGEGIRARIKIPGCRRYGRKMAEASQNSARKIFSNISRVIFKIEDTGYFFVQTNGKNSASFITSSL